MSNSITSPTWESKTEIPVSYFVAFALGMAVLVITSVSLCVLAVSLRMQYHRQHLRETILADDDNDETSSVFIGCTTADNRQRTNSFYTPKSRQLAEWQSENENEKGQNILDI